MSRRFLLLAVAIVVGAAGILFVAFPTLIVGVAGGLFCGLGHETRADQAETGDAGAQAVVAGYAYFGECGVEDPVQGRRFAERAAAQGHRDGLFWLGLYRARGVGGSQDLDGSIAAYRALINAGDLRGAAKLGDLYAHGVRGEETDRVEAYFYLHLAEILEMDSEINTRNVRRDTQDKAREPNRG